MPEISGASANGVNPSLVALKPRQVLLAKSDMEQSRGSKLDKDTKSVALEPEQKVLLLYSIAHYLERSGFRKTLKKFQSEADIANNDFAGTIIDVEQIFCKYLGTSCHAASFKSAENGRDEKVEKKKTKMKFESVLLAERSNVEASKEVDDNIVPDDYEKKPKDKKKTNKSDSKLVGDNDKDHRLESISMATVDTKKDTSSDNKKVTGSEIKEKPEDKKEKTKEKKKKDKSDSKVIGDNVEDHRLKPIPRATEETHKDTSDKRKVTGSEIDQKAEDKKKKIKRKSNLLIENAEQRDQENGQQLGVEKAGNGVNGMPTNETSPANDTGKTKGKKRTKDDKKASEEGEADKVSKKRKRSDNDEDSSPPDGQDDNSRRKKQNKDALQIETTGAENHNGVNGIEKTPEKQPAGLMNGRLEKTEAKSTTQKSTNKQQNASKEPKKPFQRVNVEEVVFTDERLQDNSYWAKDGAETGYGSKAQEILGQVRGRDFRHEKTKKKRGNYRGGQIDLHSHSIKFNYSDEE